MHPPLFSSLDSNHPCSINPAMTPVSLVQHPGTKVLSPVDIRLPPLPQPRGRLRTEHHGSHWGVRVQKRPHPPLQVTGNSMRIQHHQGGSDQVNEQMQGPFTQEDPMWNGSSFQAKALHLLCLWRAGPPPPDVSTAPLGWSGGGGTLQQESCSPPLLRSCASLLCSSQFHTSGSGWEQQVSPGPTSPQGTS